ncbi:MAG: amidohydrolase [Bacilli bacterium]
MNGRFYTLQASGHMVGELWVEHGTIIHLGSHPQWRADETIDVQGWTGFPGWVDAHLHILGYGEKLTLLQLNKSQDKNWILQQIRHHLNAPFIYAQGHVEQALTKHDLDQLSSSIPILLRHADYHGATVNSALLHQIGLSQHPTGILHEAEAMRAVQSIPKYSQATLTTMIQAAMKQLHAYGVTGGHSDDLYYFNGYHDTLAAFESALKTMPFRTHLLIHHREMGAFLASGRPWGNQHPYLQLGAIKTFYDGTLSSQTALMHHPYQGSTQQGERQFHKESWRALLQSIRQAGLPIAIHTIGDLALDEVADWLTQYPVKSGLHDRIIHASFAKKSTIEKLKRLSVIFDIQPQFLASDLPWGLHLISPKTELIYPWKTYLDAGLVLCGSSDAPVEIPDPLKGIEALTRRRSDHDQKIYQPDQRLTMEEAVKLYTIGANAPTYDLAHRGQLKEGFLADFTFVNIDFLKEPTRLSEAKVMMTVVDNHIVYRRN